MASLDELLDTWSVIECDEMNIALSVNHDGDHPEDIGGAVHPHPGGWFAVCNDDGVVAYFANQTDAFRWRLDMINRVLNP